MKNQTQTTIKTLLSNFNQKEIQLNNLDKTTTRTATIAELLGFLWKKKQWLLLPIVISLLMLGILLTRDIGLGTLDHFVDLTMVGGEDVYVRGRSPEEQKKRPPRFEGRAERRRRIDDRRVARSFRHGVRLEHESRRREPAPGGWRRRSARGCRGRR